VIWVNGEKNSQTTRESKRDQVKMSILSVTSYLLPLASSIPPFWGGIMTLPFLLYLIGLLGNLQTLQELSSISSLVIVLCPLLLIVYCVVYLWRRKGQVGLVTTGPYRFVRHPQYFSVTIFTFILTFQSVWILQHTFGIGWLTADQTILLWAAMLVAYVGIAWIEERHLNKVFDSEWEAYRDRVGFLIPFVHFKSRLLEVIACLVIPVAILYASLFLFR
jgi:protein-S-isoprenylcysteine O-methyltransferase Ste14